MKASSKLSDDVKHLLAAKVHLAPKAYDAVPREAQEQFDNPWALATALGQHLQHLPHRCLRFLAEEPQGHLVITPGGSGYAPGPQTISRRELLNVASIGVPALLEGRHALWRPVGQLLDHLLGCHGEPDGPWLSDGHGITPQWQEVGQRIQELYPLSYGLDEETRSHPHAYLAGSLAWYLLDRQRLEVADPPVTRLLRTTLLDEHFWGRAL